MIMITGQKAIMTARQARFQIVDVIASMKPLTKMTRQIVSAASIPTIVRDAFRVAMEERPGPGAPGTAGGRRGRGSRSGAAPDRPGPSDRTSGRPSGGARSRGGDDPGGQAAADHDRRRRQPSPARRAAVELRAAHPASVLQHPDGQGRGHRRLQPLHGHGRPVGAATMCTARSTRPT